MYAIETDLGRFQAETEKEAKQQLRKAQRAARIAQAKSNENYAIAHDRAACQAYNFYYQKHSTGELPRGWRLFEAAADTYSCKRVADGWSIETNDGRISINPYDGITHYVENGAGFCIAVALPNQDFKLYAVGVCGDAACWLPIPGISLDDVHQVDRS